MSKLDAKTSVAIGLGSMALVWGIYGQALPPLADVRVGGANDPDAASAEKAARWTSAAAVTVIAVIAKDATVAIMGGSMMIALSWLHRHANAVDPMTKTPIVPSSAQLVHAGDGAPEGYGLS